jgi:putative CocE/NonD family hydrolase
MPEENQFITMSDGVRIAITLHLPETEGPWPVVFEARPYRKDDLSWAGSIYRRLVDEGDLAVCRADVRGTGSSEGVAEDEYTDREWQDHLEVFDWLTSQAWCNGSIGMYGTSYSGFNSLQMAALRPPALKAIIPIYATDRRYTDDVHYGGGIRRGIDFLDYPLNMVAMNALPPVPSVFGEGWRDEWRKRVEANPPWELRWLQEQNEAEYWRHGSVSVDHSKIEAATMIIAGHADGYHNMAFRTFEAVSGPRKLLFGGWSHMSPRFSMPGPRIDHVPEMIRWWDRWLRGTDNGVDREPPIQMFVRRSTVPEPDLDSYRGHWQSEPVWPPERMREDRRSLDSASEVAVAGVTTPPDASAHELEVRGDVGVTGSIWCAAELPFGPPWDQRADEPFSISYDWPALSDELEIMGHPTVALTVASTTPVAFVSAKLCDVFPDGTSALVTRAVLNLTHRDSHDEPVALEPGERYRVEIELDATSWIWEVGHRVRLDIAGADFPSSWPPPSAPTLTVDPGASALVLPVLDGPSPAEPPTFTPGEELPVMRAEDLAVWRVEEEVVGRKRRVVIDNDYEAERENGIWTYGRSGGSITVSTTDPGDCVATGGSTYELRFPEATVKCVSNGTLRSTRDTWELELELEVSENGEVWHTKKWERRIPRALQ